MTTARELTSHLARLLREEQGAMADFLLALADFDRKKMWRELGHTSLFYYLHRELRLSKGAAQNRKTAAELIQAYPEVEAALRAGDLCLSTVNELARVLTPENHADVLPRFFGLSRREAEAVAATLRPAEMVPTRDVVTGIRAVAPAVGARPSGVVRPAVGARPAPVAGWPEVPGFTMSAVHPDEPPTSAASVDEPSAPASATAAGTASPVPVPARDSTEHLDGEMARLHITVSRAFLEKLEAAKDALGHACPEGGTAEILERGLDLILAQHAKRQGLVEKPREAEVPSRSERVPAAVKREVWRRAGGRCEWTFESGERCDRRRRLEYDHVVPRALGGPSTSENIRLTCKGHNLLAARRVFGDVVIDRYAARPGTPRASQPASAPDLFPPASRPRSSA